MKSLKSVVIMLSVLLLAGIMSSNVAYAESTDDVRYERCTYFGQEAIYVKDTIENEAGNSFELMYDASLEWPDTEEETLAKFLNYEGGTDEDKEMIAKVIANRIKSPYFPDNVKDVLNQKYMFFLHPKYWNSMKDVTEEEIQFAKAILEAEEETEYLAYMFKMPEDQVFIGRIRSERETFDTQNYIFYK